MAFAPQDSIEPRANASNARDSPKNVGPLAASLVPGSTHFLTDASGKLVDTTSLAQRCPEITVMSINYYQY
jgi:hypothetical protein